ncbi:hypothetical protein CRG98_015366 [Punica granatum]|uniref:Uncharacterized protein n=1 Tax=Punica granatum TaxID=22663 RepID=A0A2I0K956_PUNGR|nr:hypothetical protein CRG98_015366 [Punica granatum]
MGSWGPTLATTTPVRSPATKGHRQPRLGGGSQCRVRTARNLLKSKEEREEITLSLPRLRLLVASVATSGPNSSGGGRNYSPNFFSLPHSVIFVQFKWWCSS